MRRIWALAKKEFLGLINSPMGYVVMVPFLVLTIFFWLRLALLRNEANLRDYFTLLPWFLLFLAPALTMRTIAEEKRSGTANLLFAHPFSEWEIALGKFLGVFLFWLVILGGTLGLVLTLIIFSKPDFGQIFSQYLGGIFLGGGFLAIGIVASSLTKNSLSAFLLGVVGNFLLVILGSDFVLLSLPYPFSEIASQLSYFSHLENFVRGVADLRDLFWFLTLITLALLGAVYSLSYRRLVERPSAKRRLTIIFGILLLLGIGFNLLFRTYPLRLDLTCGRLYTLSEGTKKILKNLPDLVTLTLYVSRDLPPEIHQTYQAVEDLLEDYRKSAPKNLAIKIVYPDLDPSGENEAIQAGIEPVTFSKIGAGKFGMQKGYLGILIRFGEKTEKISFIQNTEDLEYQLSRRIQRLVSGKEFKIALYKNGYLSTQIMEEILKSQYQVESLYQPEKPKEATVMIVIDDGSLSATQSAFLKEYLEEGGRVLYLGGGVTVNPGYLFAQKTQSTLMNAFTDWGIKINSDIIYDLRLNEILSFSDGRRRYLLSYPFWMKALVEEKFAPLAGIKTVILGWPSSLQVEEKEGIKTQKILVSSKAAGHQEGSFDISPAGIKSLKAENKEFTLGVVAEKEKGKLVVVGNALLVEDQFVGNSENNLAFLVNILDWLTASGETANIPLKPRGGSVFLFRAPWQPIVVQIGNLATPALGSIGWAVWWLRRRVNRQHILVKKRGRK